MRSPRAQLGLGIVLILLGIWFFAETSIPSFNALVGQYTEWPLSLVAIGAILLLLSLILGAPGMAVPAAIVAGIGGIFYYQEQANDYESWAYMWALIPGFVGVGSIVAGLLGEHTRHNIRRGLNLLVISAVLFLVFSSVFGGWRLLEGYGPAIVLVLLGLYVLGSGLYRSFRGRRGAPAAEAPPPEEPPRAP